MLCRQRLRAGQLYFMVFFVCLLVLGFSLWLGCGVLLPMFGISSHRLVYGGGLLVGLLFCFFVCFCLERFIVVCCLATVWYFLDLWFLIIVLLV